MIINDPELKQGDHVKILGGEWHTVTAQDVTDTRAAFRAAADCKPPDGYARGLSELAPAPSSRYEQQYREARRAEFTAMRRKLDAAGPLVPRAAEGTDIPAAPDPYKAAIQALKEKEARRR